MDAGIGASLGRAVLYLGGMAVPAAIYMQWQWARTAERNVLVLVRKADGGGQYSLAPREGGSVSLKDPNPESKTTRMWPINELATIDVPYPGVGFLPRFLQKNIRMCIVDESDWEPMLNRSPYLVKVASPDIIAAIKEIAEATDDEDLKADLFDLIEGVTSGPTREMIASPAVLGNLLHEKVSEVAIAVYKDVLDPLKAVISKMSKLLSPTTFWIGIAILGVVVGAATAVNYMQLKRIGDDIALIMQANGIVRPEEQPLKLPDNPLTTPKK